MKKQILYIQSSIFGEKGVSTQLAEKLVAKLAREGDADITFRNVSDGHIPYYNAVTIEAVTKGNAELAFTLIEEVKKADIIVVAAPMYNFTIPAQLKSWFDHIAQAGITFKYTPNGPVGLLSGKHIYVVTARGGLHKGKSSDHHTPYFKTMFGLLGLNNIEFIYAEGLNLSGDNKKDSIAAAQQDIEALAG